MPYVKGWNRAPAERGTRFDGEAALAAAAKILPKVNAAGGNTKAVKEAASVLDDLNAPENLFGALAGRLASATRVVRRPTLGGTRSTQGATLKSQPPEVRLALEMAAHEQTERVWLAGELLDLEQAWRDAEELAAFADSLGVSTTLERQLEELKRKNP